MRRSERGGAELATVDEATVLDLCARGRDALTEARSLEEAQHLLGLSSTLTTAVRATKLTAGR
jgi:hypothetical protein